MYKSVCGYDSSNDISKLKEEIKDLEVLSKKYSNSHSISINQYDKMIS